jgi:hypothetical protein
MNLDSESPLWVRIGSRTPTRRNVIFSTAMVKASLERRRWAGRLHDAARKRTAREIGAAAAVDDRSASRQAAPLFRAW